MIFEIIVDGIAARIITERPEYHLFTNNCQNFVAYLVKVITSGNLCPQTFSDILARLFVCTPASTLAGFPGTYPPSIVPSEEIVANQGDFEIHGSANLEVRSIDTFYTFYTASDDTYQTARTHLEI